MLVSVKINNCLIYNSETEFSMQANRHYKRFPNNVATFEAAVTKSKRWQQHSATAILFFI